MNKFFIVIFVAIIAVSGYYLLRNTPENTPESIPQTLNSDPTTLESTPQSIAEEKIITYTDAGYSPFSLNIKVGDTVVFKNESSRSMWPASATHPAHKDYPTTGGCLGSTFDACQGVQPGESWSFKFNIVGNWKYHNHLSPKDFGSIIVE